MADKVSDLLQIKKYSTVIFEGGTVQIVKRTMRYLRQFLKWLHKLKRSYYTEDGIMGNNTQTETMC